MITIECASLKGFLDCASLNIANGTFCAVLTETEFERNLLLKIFTGLAIPDSGRIDIFGKNISALSQDELYKLRTKIGVVPHNGGLISNLKVWENIMLPLSYHSNISTDDAEKKMLSILDKIGYNDDLTILPGPLPVYKKRLAGLARMMLMEPDLIIYDSVFDGLSSDIKKLTVETITSFHREKEGRVSIFLDMDEGLLDDIKVDCVYELRKGKFHERN